MSSDRNIEPLQGVLVYDSRWKKPLRHSPSSSPMISSMPLHMENIKKAVGTTIAPLQYLSRESKASPIPWKRIDAMKLPLTARRGQLIGRRTLRKEITTVLQHQSRLVSLVGTAGVGKSRLALEVIYDLQDPDCGTFFCDLTEATSKLGVALTVARAMNIKLRNLTLLDSWESFLPSIVPYWFWTTWNRS